MPQKSCGFGFDCASMMMEPGLDPKDCPNWKTCGRVQRYTPEEEVELVRSRMERRRMIRETFRITRREAATMMLMERGNPQRPADFGIDEAQSAISQQLEDLTAAIEVMATDYIAPPGTVVHKYNVKRPGPVVEQEDGTMRHFPRVYTYNKLLASSAIFEPVEDEYLVRAIHLSHNHDPRNIQARLGMERRNRLMQIQTQLQMAKAALEEATAIAQAFTDIPEPVE